MKDSKRIDNKMKAKRLAAYALATCMTVTVAPVGAVTPVMADEVQVDLVGAAATVKFADITTVKVANTITAGMKFKDAVNKITITDTATTDNIGTLTSNHITILDENGDVLYDDLSTPAKENYKFEVGKTYTIKAGFDTTGYTPVTGANLVKADGNVATFTTTSGLEMQDYKVELLTNSTDAKLDEFPNAKNERYYRNGKGEIQKITSVVQCGADWYYIKDGKVTVPTSDTIVSNAYGDWLIGSTAVSSAKQGKVLFDFNGGIQHNDGKFYYIDGGKVVKDATGVFTPEYLSETAYNTGSAAKNTTKYYYEKGVFTEKETVAHEKSTGEWLYVGSDGIAPITLRSAVIVENENGSWYIAAGPNKVTFAENGIKTDGTKSYFVVNSKVDTKKNGPVVDTDGSVIIFKEGVEDKTATLTKETVIHEPKSGKWYAVKKTGALNTGVKYASNEYGTWAINPVTAEVDFDYTGVAIDDDGKVSRTANKYYIKNGKIDYSFTGFAKDENATYGNNDSKVYWFENGIATGKDDEVLHDKETGTWYCVSATGLVAQPASKLAKNAYGTWTIKANGSVDFSEKGFFTSGSDEFFVLDGKVQDKKTGWADNGTDHKWVIEGKVSAPKSETVAQCGADWYYADPTDAEGLYSGAATLAKNENGIWYISAGTGKVDFTIDDFYGPISSSEAKLGNFSAGDKLYIKGGKV